MTDTTPITLDLDPSDEPWSPASGESSLWHGRFWRYCQMGTERSLLGAYRLHLLDPSNRTSSGNQRSPRRIPSSWQHAASRYRWRERAAAWDEHNRRRDEEIWNQRYRQHREGLWEIRDSMLERVRAMLLWPLSDQEIETTGPDGEPRRVLIRGTGWKPADLHRAIELLESTGASAIGDANAAIALVRDMGYKITSDGDAGSGADAESGISLSDIFD